MKTITLNTIAAIFFTLFAFSSCSKMDMNTNNSGGFPKAIFSGDKSEYDGKCGDETSVDLMAGQHFDAGNIIVYNDLENLYVIYEAENDWQIGAIHLYVGPLDELPTNRSGNPQIGHFPYNLQFDPFVTTYIITIPLETLDDCFIIAAHAEVHRFEDGEIVQSETGWGAGDNISDGSWAMLFKYCVQECDDCTFETIYYDFIGGQTIPTGVLEVTNDDEYLYVTFTTKDGWFLQQTHLYVGTLEDLPTNNSNTPVPGQFPYSESHNPATDSYTYTIPLEGLPPCYIIAAHAETVKIVDGEIVQEETSWSFGEKFPNTTRWGWYSPYCTQVCE